MYVCLSESESVCMCVSVLLLELKESYTRILALAHRSYLTLLNAITTILLHAQYYIQITTQTASFKPYPNPLS